MLPSAIVTIKELIQWEYARLISEEASGDRRNWLFNLHNFEQLANDKKIWPRILKEEAPLDPNKCAYCGSETELVVTRIVPKNMCKDAESHNIIRVCKKCNLSKANKDLIEWEFFEARDKIPRSVMARYLKILYMCHECNGTIYACALNKKGSCDIAHIRYVFKDMCDPSKTKL